VYGSELKMYSACAGDHTSQHMSWEWGLWESRRFPNEQKPPFPILGREVGLAIELRDVIQYLTRGARPLQECCEVATHPGYVADVPVRVVNGVGAEIT
jgi:hypothetical protein